MGQTLIQGYREWDPAQKGIWRGEHIYCELCH